MISAAGLVCCLLTSFLATHVQTVANHPDVEKVLKVQLFVSALLMTAATLPLALYFLPDKFTFSDFTTISTSTTLSLATCTNIGAWVSVVCGLWGGCIIGFVTEYYTSHSYNPVRDVADACTTGAAPNIIYGLALGYLSTIIPIFLLAVNVFVAFTLCGMYGVSLAALGMLGTLATCLSIDVYGPIADNAGGLAEMSEFPKWVRDKTDALDAAGNTTAAIGKGFAIGSAALVSLALFGGFVSRVGSHSPSSISPACASAQLRGETCTTDGHMVNGHATAQWNPSAGVHTIEINVLRPITFAFLFLGAMLPYCFTAFCMKSVGTAAKAMVENIRDQFEGFGAEEAFKAEFIKQSKAHKGDWLGDGKGADILLQTFKALKKKPDYDGCIAISTDASLKEMIPPALLVMGTPLLTGAIFGVEAVCGLLVGSVVSAVQLAISQSNSGGAWDNAKKYIEGRHIKMKMLLKDAFPKDKVDKSGKDFNTSKVFKDFESNKDYDKIELDAKTKKPVMHQNGRTCGPYIPKASEAAATDISFSAYDNEEYFMIPQGKKTDVHQAGVVGDTVGDPLKDTSGPALNIVMKLMAILSLVFADFFVSINNGRGLVSMPTSLNLVCTASSECPVCLLTPEGC